MQVNAVTFLESGLLATAAGKSVALWDVAACTMKQTLQHEGAVSLHAAPMMPCSPRRHTYAGRAPPTPTRRHPHSRPPSLHISATPSASLASETSPRCSALYTAHPLSHLPPSLVAPHNFEPAARRAQVNALHLNHEGNLLATCGNDRKVTLWSIPKGDRLKELTLDGWVKAVTFSRDGSLLAAAGATANVHLWDLPAYLERHKLPHEGTVNALAFTADAQLLASGGMDKHVRVWDVSSGSQLQALQHEE